MPTSRCEARREDGDRCPGVFAFRFDDRPNGSVQVCPLCGAPNRWVATMEEWMVEADGPGRRR